MAKTTGVKRKYLKSIQDKGLAAWRVGHRPGVSQLCSGLAGRVYAFVMAAPSSTGPGKPDHKLAKEAGGEMMDPREYSSYKVLGVSDNIAIATLDHKEWVPFVNGQLTKKAKSGIQPLL